MRFVSALFSLVIAHTLLFAQQADRFAGVAPRMQEFVDKGEASGIVTLIATRIGFSISAPPAKPTWPASARCAPTTSSGSRP